MILHLAWHHMRKGMEHWDGIDRTSIQLREDLLYSFSWKANDVIHQADHTWGWTHLLYNLSNGSQRILPPFSSKNIIHGVGHTMSPAAKSKYTVFVEAIIDWAIALSCSFELAVKISKRQSFLFWSLPSEEKASTSALLPHKRSTLLGTPKIAKLLLMIFLRFSWKFPSMVKNAVFSALSQA